MEVLETSDTNAILDWDEYCSPDYYNYILARYQSWNGITFVLKHNDNEAEHITLNSNNEILNLKQILHSKPGLTNNVIAHIRNHVNFNKRELKSFSFHKTLSRLDKKTNKNNVNFIKLHNREYIHGLNGPTYMTRAEKKCLLLALKMKTSKEIAIETGTTIRTVECHLANIKKKLGTKKKHELYELALKNFILSN